MTDQLNIMGVLPFWKRVVFRFAGGRIIDCTPERLVMRVAWSTRSEEAKEKMTRGLNTRGHHVEWDGPVVTITRVADK